MMLNFQRLFESIPGLYIIYDLNFVIVGGSNAYFQATMTKREEVIGRHLFEVFPDNPDDPNADGVRNLRASLENVLKYGKPHTMAVQKYDIRRPEPEGGGFEERYWTPMNSPFFDENGVMTHIIHRAVDVTEFVQMQQQRNEQRQLNQTLQSRTEQMEMEIYARAQELQEVNAQLQTANEALSELDRDKTIFFSNVSHEFRTPLTLMLAPLQDALTSLEEWKSEEDSNTPSLQHLVTPSSLKELLQLVQRNGLRLLKLVNTLLDFSRIEAGRVQAMYEPVDLATYTAELASTFRSLVEQAGISLVVDCPTLPAPVYVDREMWEKIVLNLLSNAFKFTFEGEIWVSLHIPPSPHSLLGLHSPHVILEVRDTGVGIPPEELPYLFERFHRVENSQGRSFEGSGIGLSLVQELVKLHAGAIEVTSTLGHGSCFTVTLPTGTAHLPPDRVDSRRTCTPTAVSALPYVEEAQRWLPGRSGSGDEWMGERVEEYSSPHPPIAPPTHRPKILLVDDNADMRHYIQRLLSGTYSVETIVDGVEALTAIQNHPPDLILTDMMMPRMDGVELLQELRSHPQTAAIPVILLSAQASEEARMEGLAAGADDYMIKPFSARELLARVEATLKLSTLRREALQREQTLRTASETAQQKAEVAFRRIDQLLESMSEAFVALDHDWRIIYQNAAAERINNKPRSEVLGKTLWEEWPAAVGSISDRQYRHAIAEQIPVHFEQHYYEPPDHDVWLEVHAYPFEEGLGIFYRDISDRKCAEVDLRESEARLAADLAGMRRLYDLYATLATGLDLKTALNEILAVACEFTHTDRGCVQLVSDDGTRLEMFTWYGYSDDSPFISHFRHEGFKEGCDQARVARQRFMIEETIGYPGLEGTEAGAAAYAEGIRAAQSTPIINRSGESIGVLSTQFSQPHRPSDDELRLVDLLAWTAADFIERYRTLTALRESEEKYRSLFTSIDEGFCIVEMLFDENNTPIDYRFLETNPVFEQQTGLQQAIGNTARQLVPGLENHWIETYGRVALTGEPIRFENGSEVMNRWFDVYACRTGAPSAHKVAIVFKDISDRKRTEAILRRTAELDAFRVSLADALRPLTDASEIQAIATRILGESLQANRVVYVEVVSEGEAVIVHRNYTNGVAKLNGRYRLADYRRNLTADHQAGHTQIVTDIPNDARYTEAEQARYHELEIAAHIDVPLIKNHQFVALLAVHQSTPRQWTETEIKLVEETAERTWAAVERAHTEAALRDSENRFRMAIEAAQLGTWDWNLVTNQMIWDEGCKAMFGLPPATEVSIEVFFAGLHPDDRDRLEQVVQWTLNPASNGKYDAEYRTIGIQDGIERWVSARGQAYFDGTGKPQRFVGTALNITEQKRIEAEREQLFAREQAAREAADRANQIKDEFLAVLSHELRSPLNPILGWSKLLQQKKLDAAKTTTALATIERNAQLQVQLIDDLLDISRILRGKLSLTTRPVDLHSVINAALETVRLAAEAKNIQVHTSVLPGVGVVMGDAGRLQQVVWNLLSNAVKFTPAHGQVTIALSASDRHAQIQVSDTGKGIKPEFLPYVFEHFRQEDGTTTRQFGGLGLGLAIVRQMVELHGGTVAVASSGEGMGATFTVQIPLVSRIRMSPAIEPVSNSSVNLGGVRVLVVDDEVDSREFIAFVLEQAGAIVTTVSSGSEALQTLSQKAPDIIVSDIGMPDMDGYMLMQQIRAQSEGKQIPSIALTAYAGEINQQQAIAAGFQRHLSKPVEPEAVIQVIRACVIPQQRSGIVDATAIASRPD